MRHTSYSSYRPSEVEWLGDIPEHWQISRLRRVARLEAGEGITSEEIDDAGDFPVFGGNGVRGFADRYTHEGEFVLIGRQGALCGNVHLARGKFWASEHAVVATPVDAVSAPWLCRVTDAMKLNQYSTAAAQPGLAVDRISALGVPLPPVDEQRAIAMFLERETAKVDALIAKKQQLIERLAEYRTALITRTVTKGLPPDVAETEGFDPSPQLKPSGVEWLGEVPGHWEVNRLSRMVTCLDGRRIPLNSEQRADLQGEYPYWGANGVLDHLNDWLFDEPLVLLGEDGAPFFDQNKNVAFAVSGKIWVNNHAHVLQPTHINQKFLTHSLNITDYAAFIDGSTRDKLTQGDMNAIPILVPPANEQRTITAFLDKQIGHINTLSSRVEAAVERLHEFRSALVTAAVTGKIDVREFEPVETEGSAA